MNAALRRLEGEAVRLERCFFDDDEARAFVERLAWPQGAVCPRCGSERRTRLLKGGSTRAGTFKCYRCRKPFTVTVATAFEGTHLPLRLWLQAVFLFCAGQRPLSIREAHLVLGVAPKTAAMMRRRIESTVGARSGRG